jgi:carboxyl-terminal processing protease
MAPYPVNNFFVSQQRPKHPPYFGAKGWFTAACLGVMVGAASLTGCQYLPFWGHRPTSQPLGADSAQSLYDEVWQTVDNDYYDANFNHQDWESWHHRYDGLLKDDDDAAVAIRTMLTSLDDDYTRYLRKREMQEQDMSIDSRLYGVGVQIAERNGKIIVITPISGTPAAKAGARSGDVITQINHESTTGMDVDKAADKIRGPRGTSVQLTLERQEGRKTRIISYVLKRDEIKLKSVFVKALQPNDIGYIRLSSFISETATDEMITALREQANKKALILDLRGNFGGLLTNAVEIADLFLNKDVIVTIVGRRSEASRRVWGRDGVLTQQPLVVLIDGASASASEILGGALKDNHRAVLIGEHSFGKGLVQKIHPLQDGSGLNITISKYLTPSGQDINHKGVLPNVLVKVPVHYYPSDVDDSWQLEPQHDLQLREAIQYIESQYLAKK